jgi:hypothetical protein
MGARFDFNPAVLADVEDLARPEVLAVADEIAAGTRAKARDPEYADSVEVEATDDGAWVGTDHYFAHLDEWGSIWNPPTGAMRSSAASAGRFEEE